MFVKCLIVFSILPIFYTYGHTSILENDAIIKIAGGRTASIADFPYQVSLRIGGSHFCGGSLISSFYVLTAAHCILPYSDRIGHMGVGMGHTRLSDRQIIHKVHSAFVHPGYSKDSFPIVNDIALIRLSKAAKVDNVVVSLIPLSEETPANGTMCTVSGWGSIREPPSESEVIIEDTLRAVDIPITDHRRCARLTELNESVICAGYLQGGRDSCQGDSGGPLACGGRLAGIVSWGPGCGRPYSPGVYTDVAFFAVWVANHSLASPPPSLLPVLLVPAFLTILH